MRQDPGPFAVRLSGGTRQTVSCLLIIPDHCLCENKDPIPEGTRSVPQRPGKSPVLTPLILVQAGKLTFSSSSGTGVVRRIPKGISL